MHTRDTKRLVVLTLLGAGLLALAGCGDNKLIATTTLSGANEVGPTNSPASGTATATLDGDQLTVTGTFRDLQSDLFEVSGSSAHVHNAPAGQNGPIVLNLDVISSDQRTGSFTGSKTLSSDEQKAFRNSAFYVNVHSANFMGGEIRGQFNPK